MQATKQSMMPRPRPFRFLAKPNASVLLGKAANTASRENGKSEFEL